MHSSESYIHIKQPIFEIVCWLWMNRKYRSKKILGKIKGNGTSFIHPAHLSEDYHSGLIWDGERFEISITFLL